jgi:hypothetical protein
MSDLELKSFMSEIEDNINQLVKRLPSHQQFIERYGAASTKASNPASKNQNQRNIFLSVISEQ